MFQGLVQFLVDALVAFKANFLFPSMFIALFSAILGKCLVVFTIRRQWWFVKEFEKRTMRFTETKPEGAHLSFFVTCKKMLERTYYELFEVRGVMMRRKLDYVTSPIDRLFAIQQGCAWMVRDTLKEIRFLKHKNETPRFLEISRNLNSGNPCFGRLFGWLPLGPMNDVLNLLPGLFIIMGIFGTFLGIMDALPELGSLDLKDPEGSKMIMDTFLLKISFSISASIVGIFFSVILTVLYSLFAPEKLFVRIVDVYDRTLSRIWDYTDSNDVPQNLVEFDEHKDPIEALAHLAVEKEISSGKGVKGRRELPSTPHSDDNEGNKKAS